jgi:hypothetical protein
MPNLDEDISLFSGELDVSKIGYTANQQNNCKEPSRGSIQAIHQQPLMILNLGQKYPTRFARTEE